jgi:GNAT superfamily N-acetyltransferase
VIRPARPDDVPTILALVQELAEYEREPDAVQLTTEGLAEVLFGPSPHVFDHIVEHDGEIVGHALWFVTFSSWSGRYGIWLDELYVRPDHRGHGHGLALMRKLAEICAERGYARFEWWVLDWNEPSIEFYRSLGAVSIQEWIVNRLTGEALSALGDA